MENKSGRRLSILWIFSWGYRLEGPGEYRPGLGNISLAYETEAVKEEFNLILAQREVAVILSSHGVEPDFVVSAHRVPGEYLDTKEGLEQMILFLKGRGIDPEKADNWAMCHRGHWSTIRMYSNKRNLGMKRIKADILCDRLSAQWWTRSSAHLFVYKALNALKYFRNWLEF